jgi:hypothetical protein
MIAVSPDDGESHVRREPDITDYSTYISFHSARKRQEVAENGAPTERVSLVLDHGDWH